MDTIVRVKKSKYVIRRIDTGEYDTGNATSFDSGIPIWSSKFDDAYVWRREDTVVRLQEHYLFLGFKTEVIDLQDRFGILL